MGTMCGRGQSARRGGRGAKRGGGKAWPEGKLHKHAEHGKPSQRRCGAEFAAAVGVLICVVNPTPLGFAWFGVWPLLKAPLGPPLELPFDLPFGLTVGSEGPGVCGPLGAQTRSA
eukprot:358662-Chlamydomonas_euryale.AAC.4